ncbi:MAG: ATP-binding protein [Kofleriaceae bacterium]
MKPLVDRSLSICVLAAKHRDAELTCASLHADGIPAFAVESFDELITTLINPVGALMITEDAVPSSGWRELGARFAQQPPWSDLPAIVFSRNRHPGLEQLLVSGTGNITVLETPVRVSTVVSAGRVALRARRRQHEVRDLLARLEEADRRKDEFLAMLGHELRNPLAAIHLALQVKEMSNAQPDRETEIIARQVHNLGRIVDDLLDVSRVTLGKIQLELAQIDLCNSARRCVQALSNDAAASELSLSINVPEGPAWISGDPVRIEQVIANLVTNAIKYTPRGGKIVVSVARLNDRVMLSVRDTGIGIEPAILPGLFDLFFQAKQGLDRSRGGLGLGLSLVRRLVELHDGTLGAHSDGVGRGAEFWFELPLVERATERISGAQKPITKPRRVLLVEDNDDARDMLSMLLENEGHHVYTAADGLEGLNATHEVHPEVMLVDIGLPRLDGHELAREVRRTAHTQPWMIAMTGYGQPTDRERALASGFDMFVVKPVALIDLQHALAAAKVTS